MKVSYHVVAGFSAGVFSYTYCQESVFFSTVLFLSNSLIDADHIVDYCYEYREFPNRAKLFRACYSSSFKRCLLPLHSYELLLVLLFLVVVIGGDLIRGMFFGFSLHLFMDQLYWGVRNPGLFLCYRWRKKFSMDALGDPDRLLLKRARISGGKAPADPDTL